MGSNPTFAAPYPIIRFPKIYHSRCPITLIHLAFIGPGLAAFESLLEGVEQRPFSTGDSPGLADICLIPQLYNANRWGVPLTGLDRVQSIAKACAALPAFQAAHPDAVRP